MGTLLVVAAIAFGVASSVAANLTTVFAERAIETSVLGASESANLQILGIDKRLNENVLRRVREVAGVAEARPVIEGSATLGDDGADALAVRVQGIDVLQSFPGSSALRKFNPGPFAPPGRLEEALIARRGVIVSRVVARRFGIAAGSRIRTQAGGSPVVLRVVLVLPDTTTGIDPYTILVDVTTARKMLGDTASLDRIDVVTDRAQTPVVQRRIAAVLSPHARVVTSAERIAALERLTQGSQLNFAILAFVALALGAVLVANAMSLSVRERRPDIAILRTLGATRRQILLAFLTEGAAMGALGGIIGAIVGDELARTVSGFGDPLSLAESGAQFAADTVTLARGTGVGFLLSIGAALVPALEAASVMPASALPATPLYGSRASALRLAAVGVFLIGAGMMVPYIMPDDGKLIASYVCPLVCLIGVALCVPLWPPSVVRLASNLVDRLPAAGRLAVARFGANATRLSLAIVALVISVCASIGVATATTSFRATVHEWSMNSFPGDLELRAAKESTSLPASLDRRLSVLPGVALTRISRRVEVPFRNGVIALAVLDERTLERQGTPLGPTDAILTENLAKRFRLGVGSRLSIGRNRTLAALRVRYIVNDYESPAGTLTIAQRSYVTFFKDSTVDAISVTARQGTSLDRLRSALIAAASPLAIEVGASRQMRVAEEASFERFYSLASAVGRVSIGIAVFSTAATMMALVAEQRRQLLLLRVLGLSVGAMRCMIVYETCLAAGLGALLGVVTGLGFGVMLVLTLDRLVSGYMLIFTLPVATILVTPVIVVGTAMLAAIVPARSASKRYAAPALGIY